MENFKENLELRLQIELLETEVYFLKKENKRLTILNIGCALVFIFNVILDIVL